MRCGASTDMTTSYFSEILSLDQNREQRLCSTVKQDTAFDLTRLQFLLLGMNKQLISSVADKLSGHISQSS